MRTERQSREVSGERRHDAGEHTVLPSHSQPMLRRAHSQYSAPPRCHRVRSARYERQPMAPQHHHSQQPTHRWYQAHSSRRPQHLRKPPHPSLAPRPHPSPSAAPEPARSAPPPGDPCCSAAPAPTAPGAMSLGDHRDAGPSWLPPYGARPSTVLPVLSSRRVRTATPTGTCPLRLVVNWPTRALLSPLRPTSLLKLARPIVTTVSARLPHHSRRLRHQRTASQAAALTASSPTSQGQLLCTMATIHLSPIAIRSRPTPHRSRLPGRERLESLIITISSKTTNWVLVSPRPTHRRTSSPLPPALSPLSSPVPPRRIAAGRSLPA